MRIVQIFTFLLGCTASMMAQQSGTANLPVQGNVTISSTGQFAPSGRAQLRQAPPQRSPLVSTGDVPPSAPVLTLEGVCGEMRKPDKQAACKTVITRAQLDSLVDILMPGATQQVRSQFAVGYARMLAGAELARRRHLENNPSLAKEMKVREQMARAQVLASGLYKTFEAEGEISPSEIREYYNTHAGEYEEAEVERLVLPKAALTENGQPLDLAAVKSMAESMRERALDGAAFAELEQEAYNKLGIKSQVPTIGQITSNRNSLPADQAKVLDLKPGEVSEVLDSYTSFVVMKLISKKSIPLEQARPELVSILRNQRMQQELRAAEKSVKAEFNLQYLGLTSPPDLFPPPGSRQATNRARIASRMRYRGSAGAVIPRNSAHSVQP